MHQKLVLQSCSLREWNIGTLLVYATHMNTCLYAQVHKHTCTFKYIYAYKLVNNNCICQISNLNIPHKEIDSWW